MQNGCAAFTEFDRDTSGVMVFAKSAEMQRRLIDNRANAEKLYIVAVYGHLAKPIGVLSGYLAQDEKLLGMRSAIPRAACRAAS